MEYSKLLSPMKIGNVEIKNRVVMAPMEMGFGQISGEPTDMLIDYYEKRAEGGVGLIIPGITRVNDFTGASTFQQLAVSRDCQIEPLKELVNRIHKHGTKIFIQLHHPGRQNVDLLVGTVSMSMFFNKFIPKYPKMLVKVVPAGTWMAKKGMVLSTVAPSKCERAYMVNSKVRGLTKLGVKKLIKDFIKAAVRCQKAGIDGVELHASHGYLIQQFLSPQTNHRTDEYGGSLENRMRFMMEIYNGIRKECGKDYPIIVRLTVDECYAMIGQNGKGYDLEEGVEMAKILDKAGVDALDISCGGYDNLNSWLEPVTYEVGWRKYMAEAVKKEVSCPVIAANLIRSPEQAEQQLEDGIQDFISMGRPFLADPMWVKKVTEHRENEIKRCICCLNCFETMQKNAYVMKHGECAVNPTLGIEREDAQMPKDGTGRLVLVVGAGPAGLMSAEVLARRGFKVKVFEKNPYIGGQLQLANKPPKKDKISWCFEDLAENVKKYGGEIKLNTLVDEKVIEELDPYAVVVATGGLSIHPKSIKGADKKNVATVTKVLDGTLNLQGKKVAVIGSGMTGLETAELLVDNGNEVTIVEMANEVAPGTWIQHLDDILPRLKDKKVEIVTSNKLVEIKDDCIIIENTKNNEKVRKDIDYVILSIGVRPQNELYKKIKDMRNNVYLVGDANSVGRIAHATKTAYETARKIL